MDKPNTQQDIVICKSIAQEGIIPSKGRLIHFYLTPHLKTVIINLLIGIQDFLMKIIPLFAFFLIGCNILDSVPYGDCEIYFFNFSLEEYVTRRGECTVNGNLLQVRDSNGAEHNFNSTSNYYSYQEVDDLYNNEYNGVEKVGRNWFAYQAGNLVARVILDFNPV